MPTLQPTVDDIRKALARALASPPLAAAPRLSAFLGFVVEQTLAGAGTRLKGYTIAVEALGRAADFNPQADAIVRVEAGRLRRALGRYYAGAGREEPVAIELRRGTYVPVFHFRSRPHPLPDIAAPPGVPHLADALERLISYRTMQVRALLAEIRSARLTLRRHREILDACGEAALACCPPALLLPRAEPETFERGRGPQTQQAEGASAARTG